MNYSKKKLDGEIPIFALLEENIRVLRFSDIASKLLLPVEVEKNISVCASNPSNFKKYDIVDIKMDGLLAKHAAIYLGNDDGENYVAHISGVDSYVDKARRIGTID